MGILWKYSNLPTSELVPPEKIKMDNEMTLNRSVWLWKNGKKRNEENAHNKL